LYKHLRILLLPKKFRSNASILNRGNFMKKALLLSMSFVTLMTVGALAAETATQSTTPAPAPGTAKMPPSHGDMSPTASSDEKIPVAKAIGPNAITVAEAFSNSARLNKKKVTVSGRVVKLSTGIMKRNWIHIQDGTGSKKKNNIDLVCTSKDTAAVGEVVTVSGTLVKDRDFGSGYSYKVIIENATFSK
jgi:hypothetical protein